ncbi:glycosyltransferase family 4 protein [Cesiribacter sp. SM1]|uniref:glycosyltransferase family 4 protein n=1 Tax=Cesiribacter sp. SM1 TaxID=2861196 RepID=UPI001CD5674C|nr:glycosyltransferase [Cesiribacter sp. SM1]
MKILLSAYACRPKFGSEHAAGWNFAQQLSKQGHQVTVLTNDECRNDIENQGGDIPANTTFVYHRLPLWIKKPLYRKTGPLAHIYYFFWQISAFFCVRNILKDNEVDLIHLITIGVFRTPAFLGLLTPPFILGPVGGGETSTPQLQRKLPFRYKLKEKLRHWANLSALINPLMYLTYQTTDLILLKTSDNLRYIPDRFHNKCRVSLEVGIELSHNQERKTTSRDDKSFKILFAGRLEYWKGVHLAIKAYAQILKKHPSTTFTIVGSGSEEQWFKETATRHNVLDKIEWLPRVEQEKLFLMYESFDVFLFPSMHDSSGHVTVEALSHGLPVVCLDLGGPKEIINEACGRVIPTQDLAEDDIIQKIVDEISSLISKPESISRMRENALLRASQFSWDKVVENNYQLIHETISLHGSKGTKQSWKQPAAV